MQAGAGAGARADAAAFVMGMEYRWRRATLLRYLGPRYLRLRYLSVRYSSTGGDPLNFWGLGHDELSRSVRYPVNGPDSVGVCNELIPIEELEDHGKSDHDESDRQHRNVKHRSHAGGRMR